MSNQGLVRKLTRPPGALPGVRCARGAAARAFRAPRAHSVEALRGHQRVTKRWYQVTNKN